MAIAKEDKLVLWSVGDGETVLREYKEFCSGAIPHLTKEEIEMIAEGHISVEFDRLMQIHLIKNYLLGMLPRYISAMGNTDFGTIPGSFMVGVHDKGMITGIPTINPDEFVSRVNETVSRVVSCNMRILIHNTVVPMTHAHLITIDCIETEIEPDLLVDDAKDMIRDYTTEKRRMEDLEREYMEKRIVHNKEIMQYNRAFTKLVKMRWYRDEVAQWVENDTYLLHLENLDRSGHFKEYVDGEHYLRSLTPTEKEHVITVLRSDDPIDTEADGGIPCRRAHPTDPLCMIILYRDFMIWRIRSNAPVRPAIVFPSNVFDLLVHTMTPLTKRILEKNSGVKYFVVRVNIPDQKTLCKHYSCHPEDLLVEYCTGNIPTENWNAVMRKHIDPMGASCVAVC